jgi:hypothetical protein
MKSLDCVVINITITNPARKRQLIVDFYRLILEHRGTETYLLWKVIKRHGRFEGHSERVRGSRSAHSSSCVHTESRSTPIKVRKSKHATILASHQQHQSKYDTKHIRHE